jgi:hypothetical protein
MNGVQIPAGAWRLGGQRPANHPQRRVAALAAMIPHWRAVNRAVERGLWRELIRLLTGVRHSFWEHHYTFQAKPSPRRMALLGGERCRGLLINAFLPAVADWEEALRLVLPERSRRVRIAAARILAGRTDTASLLKEAVLQQGLLEMYEVYCGRDVTDCLRCPFPEQHPRWNPLDRCSAASDLHADR